MVTQSGLLHDPDLIREGNDAIFAALTCFFFHDHKSKFALLFGLFHEKSPVASQQGFIIK
jgi:hypothetical protein